MRWSSARAMRSGGLTTANTCCGSRSRRPAGVSPFSVPLDRCGPDATLLFNLAVLQEDLRQPQHAIDSYRAALDADPDLADAHFNLARLCEASGLKREAVRHWSAFRKLTGAAPK